MSLDQPKTKLKLVNDKENRPPVCSTVKKSAPGLSLTERHKKKKPKAVGKLPSKKDNLLKNTIAPKKLQLQKISKVTKTLSVKPVQHLPNATKTNLYDEHWAAKQERAFMRWLNFVLAPQDEIGHVLPAKGKQALESWVQLDSLTSTNTMATSARSCDHHPPTSELPVNGHRTLSRLRRAASLLYQSQPLMLVVGRLEVEIESQQLSFHKDRNPISDIGVKQDLLHMLLQTYNPVWLKLCLETLFGEVILASTFPSMKDVREALAHFILHKLLFSRQIAADYSAGAGFREGFTNAMSQFILKKFLLLVLLLDQAKLTRMIDYDPCLFQKQSPIKSSRELLQSFSRKYLSGEGDFVRHLSHLGYTVTHVQSFLEEYDYTVTNLAVDLRDGVRLTRLTEMLTNNWGLSKQLRLPSSTKMQKLHNVQVALTELKHHMSLPACVTAESIVDGHREKTLSLLWTIIFHFKVKLHLNVDEINKEIHYIKRKYGCERRLSYEPSMFFDPTLSVLLEWCTAVCAIYGVTVSNFNSSFSDGRALCYLIHHYHPSLLTLQVISDNTTLTQPLVSPSPSPIKCNPGENVWTATFSPTTGTNPRLKLLLSNEKSNFKVISNAIRRLGGIPLLTHHKDMSDTLPDEKVVIAYVSYLCHHLFLLRRENRAAKCIQDAWKKHRLLKRDVRRIAAALTIQAWYRRQQSQQEYLSLKIAATTIQRWWRYRMSCIATRSTFNEMTQCATKIASVYRGFAARKRYLLLRNNIIRIQRMFKRARATRMIALQQRVDAAVKIQSWIRACQQSKKFQTVKKSCIVLQKQYRNFTYSRKIAQQFQKIRHACVVIQSFLRGYNARKRIENMKQASILIQLTFKSFMLHKKYLKVKHACVIIQRYFSSHLTMKRDRSNFLKLKSATITLQSMFRGARARSQIVTQHQAASKIQSTWKMFHHKKHFLAVRTSAMILQKRWRATLKMKQERNIYAIKRSKLIHLQACMRSKLTRKYYMRVHQAACVLQASFKAYNTRNKYRRKLSAIISIQSHTRCFLARKHFFQAKQAAVLIQSHTRSYFARRRYLDILKSAEVIQRYFRGYKDRQAFLTQRLTSITIQANWRKYNIQKNFNGLKQSVVVIQRKYRAHLAREFYLKQRSAVISLQTHLRRIKAQEHFSTMKRATVKLQSIFRMYTCRKRYLQTRSAVILLQASVRCFSAQLKFKCLRNAVVVLQAYVRGFLQRQQYSHLLVCLIRCQAVVRCYIARVAYYKKRNAASCLQSHIRCFTLRRRYLQMRRAAITIQTAIRRLQQQKKFARTKAAVILLQAYMRGFLARKQYQKTLSAIVTIQSIARFNLVRNRYLHLRHSAIIIQSAIRKHQQLKKFEAIKSATVLLQSYVRGYLQRRQNTTKLQCAIKLQAYTRTFLIRRKYSLIKKSAIKVQSYIRCYLARRKYTQTQSAILCLQANIRRFLARMKYLEMMHSVRVLQSFIRGHLVRKHCLIMQSSAVIIQTATRSYMQKKKYSHVRAAVIAIQSFTRGNLIRKRFQCEQSAATTLQAYFRCYKAKKYFSQKRIAAIILQTNFRRFLCQRRFLLLKASVIKVQSLHRQLMARRRFLFIRQSVVTIQGAVRYHQARTKYLIMKKAAVTIQSFVRKCIKNEQNKRVHAALLIQSLVRCLNDRKRYKAIKHATQLIQSRYRCYQIQKRYLLIRCACIKIQSLARKHLQRKKYLALRNRVILCQRLVRRSHLAKVTAAIQIQSYWRMVREKHHFLTTYVSLIKLQACVKAYLSRRKYCYLRKCTVILQHYVRCFLTYRRYQRVKRAVTVLQRHTRQYLTKKVENAHPTSSLQIASVIKIQSYYRGHLAHRNYIRLQCAAICIQQRFRSRQKLVKAALIIQRCYRKNKEMTQQRKLFLTIKAAVCTIQCWYRQKQAVQFQKMTLTSREKAAIKIQSYFRGWLARKAQNKAIVDVRKRIIQANESALKSVTIRERLPYLLETLLRSKYLSTAANVLNSLEIISSVSSNCSQEIVSCGAIKVLLSLVTQMNRSPAALALVETIFHILLNISKWPPTNSSVLDVKDSVKIIIDLMHKIYSTQPKLLLLACKLLSSNISIKNIGQAEADTTHVKKLKLINQGLKRKLKTTQSRSVQTEHCTKLHCIKLIDKLVSHFTSSV